VTSEERKFLLTQPGLLMYRVIAILEDGATEDEIDELLSVVGNAAPILLMRRQSIREYREESAK
jgi:hypothetical protein